MKMYALMNHAHIPGFPNHIPRIDWQTGLPKFKDQGMDDAGLHLVKFHLHIHKLGVYFLEDCLMNMFMATLEEDTRSWYKNLPPACVYSLKYFHTIYLRIINNPIFVVGRKLL